MIHKIVFLSLSLCLSSIAMEQKRLIPWVQNTNKITVASSQNRSFSSFTIDDATTVADIKKTIQHTKGISVEQQSFFPVIPWMFCKKTGQELDDNANIKQIISAFNTTRFLVWLSLAHAGADQK